jgi:hypothetical protein
MPIIVMGNRQDELLWWKEQRDANGYETMSVSIAPGVSTLAFWVAQQVLDGQTVPQDLIVPFLEIQQDGSTPRSRPRPRAGRQRGIHAGRRQGGDRRRLELTDGTGAEAWCRRLLPS